LVLEPHLADEAHKALLRWAEEGKLKPFVHSAYSLDEAKKAFEHVLNRTVVGKTVIVPYYSKSKL
jgi:NADPH2:quinone reductase